MAGFKIATAAAGKGAKSKGGARVGGGTGKKFGCGSGHGGFKPGNTCGKGGRKGLADRIKAARHKAKNGEIDHKTLRQTVKALREHRRGQTEHGPRGGQRGGGGGGGPDVGRGVLTNVEAKSAHAELRAHHKDVTREAKANSATHETRQAAARSYGADRSQVKTQRKATSSSLGGTKTTAIHKERQSGLRRTTAEKQTQTTQQVKAESHRKAKSTPVVREKIGTPEQRSSLARDFHDARTFKSKTLESHKAHRSGLVATARTMRKQRGEVAATEKRDRVKADKVIEVVRKGKVSLRNALNGISSPGIQKEVTHAYVQVHASTKAVPVKTRGMEHSENMHSLHHEGIDYHFQKSGSHDHAVVSTLTNVASQPRLPESLTRHTKNVYHTEQSNKSDSHWEKKYEVAGFKSGATGGDGNVVVYHGNGASHDTLTHEMGHNLSTAKYGSTHPHDYTDFTAATKSGEAHPSDYAKHSHAEDFAESVAGHIADPAGFRQKNPKRAKVIERLLSDESYHG
jgi:hypothetical protein